MALFAKIKTWSAGDKLTATDLNAEFTNIEDLLDGTTTTNAVKVTYNAADIPVIEAVSSTASAHGFEATMSGANSSGLVVHDGSAEVIDLKRDGTVHAKTFDSDIATGTAPITVASTTVCTNLNADLLDGVEGSSYLTGTGDQTITKNSANLTWEWASDTGVILKLHETSTSYEYTLEQTGDDLELKGDSTALIVLDSANAQAEFPANIDLQGNNSGTIEAVADGATVTIDCNNGPIHLVTLAGNRTLASLSNPKVGGVHTFIVKQDNPGGNRTLSWNANFKHPGGSAPTLSTGAGAVDIFTILIEDATTFYVVPAQDFS